MLNKFYNKKGQISDVMTWIIATIIILVILIAFIYISALVGQKTKIIKVEDLQFRLGKGFDFLGAKTDLAYGLASDSDKAIIDEWRKNNG